MTGINEETEKSFAELLSEELKLREAEALESHLLADISLLEAKKMTSQYQKEADKCNSGMETCEAARERDEPTLASQKRLTALWETRACSDPLYRPNLIKDPMLIERAALTVDWNSWSQKPTE